MLGDAMDPKQDYRLRFCCPACGLYFWTLREDIALTLQEVYALDWDFTCPTHGLQRGKPFQAEPRRIILDRAWPIWRRRDFVH
jgi:hypothetical protein